MKSSARPGFTLLEMALTLLVVAAISLAAWKGFRLISLEFHARNQIQSVMAYYDRCYKRAYLNGERFFMVAISQQVNFYQDSTQSQPIKSFQLDNGLKLNRPAYLILDGYQTQLAPSSLYFKHPEGHIRVTIQMGGSQYVIREYD
ncbi:PulJ/GspJ family protein [Aerococcus sanguinicola]|uniref:PulJ/GspJ family protein n=1 Tax=unclassified Aerococcus TaxID=2618060 RepID=UPI0008A51D85|nr:MULTISPECIES: prepilin-type N-terminal cleavage/methylation domain-containing protein [unclassified Aerococcus]MDK8501794.1 prepilin-type N-terminal cleavage/methylation domain-containing protein [Aerococcus sp. UMB1112A]OFN02698.1 hypothetical protein HMPREF2626_01955 [Aerococcus sp. HMSC062A02]OHO45633.1 hypothetical protein HMPREF2705_04845 [Aerococcus sp. HMSC035B07]